MDPMANWWRRPPRQTRSRGQLNINILKPKTGATYTIKVQGASADAFGVGDYFVTAQAVGPQAAALPVAPAPAPAATVTGNSSLASPAVLAANSIAADGRMTNYSAVSGLSFAGETDHYLVTAPPLTAGATAAPTMLIRVTGLDATALAGRVQVYSGTGASQAPVAFQVLVNANGLLSIQIPNAVPGAEYTVALSASAGSVKATGNYRLKATAFSTSYSAFIQIVTDPIGM